MSSARKKITVVGAGQVGSTVAQVSAYKNLGAVVIIAIVEGVIGRELPVQLQYAIQILGGVLILSLFIFTIFNDIRNIFN